MLYILVKTPKEVHKSLGHGLLPIQVGPGGIHVIFETDRMIQAFKQLFHVEHFMFDADRLKLLS
ncbi:MAG: hypothetical protein LBI95_01625 [Holosporales bacterium]|nr:hypothetical protein [Holosporales bacterium]